MPTTIATVLINEFAETEASTPLGAVPRDLVVLENGTFAALIMGYTDDPMGTTRMRLTGSMEAVGPQWTYVASVAHGMGVWHLWYDTDHTARQVENRNTREQELREKHEAITKEAQSTTTGEPSSGGADSAGTDTDADKDSGQTPADSD